MTARGGVAAATCWVLLLVGVAARAQPMAAPPATTAAPVPPGMGSAAPTRGPDVVEVTVVGRIADYERLVAPIGARTPGGVPLMWNHIDRFNPLAELLRSEPTAQPAALRCWIDLSDLRRVTLYFASRGGERFLVRELALSGRLDEVDQQSLAQVLEISIAALLESQDNGLTRAEAREILARAQSASAAPAPAAAAPRRSWAVGAAASYAVEAVAPSMPMGQAPGLILSLTSRSVAAGASATASRVAGPHLGFWLAGHYRLPVSAQTTEIGLGLEALAARVGIAAGWGRLSARLGGGADWNHVTPRAGDNAAAVMLGPPHWARSWVIGGALAARLPVDRIAGLQRVVMSLVLAVETLPATTEYEVHDDTGSRVVFALRRARPSLALELGF